MCVRWVRAPHIPTKLRFGNDQRNIFCENKKRRRPQMFNQGNAVSPELNFKMLQNWIALRCTILHSGDNVHVDPTVGNHL